MQKFQNSLIQHLHSRVGGHILWTRQSREDGEDTRTAQGTHATRPKQWMDTPCQAATWRASPSRSLKPTPTPRCRARSAFRKTSSRWPSRACQRDRAAACATATRISARRPARDALPPPGMSVRARTDVPVRPTHGGDLAARHPGMRMPGRKCAAIQAHDITGHALRAVPHACRVHKRTGTREDQSLFPLLTHDAWAARVGEP